MLVVVRFVDEVAADVVEPNPLKQKGLKVSQVQPGHVEQFGDKKDGQH